MFQECFKSVSRVFQGCIKSVSRVFRGCFKGVSRLFQGYFKECSRWFQEGLRGGSRQFYVFLGCLKDFLFLTVCFQELTKCSKDVLRVFQGNSKVVLRVFQWEFKGPFQAQIFIKLEQSEDKENL